MSDAEFDDEVEDTFNLVDPSAADSDAGAQDNAVDDDDGYEDDVEDEDVEDEDVEDEDDNALAAPTATAVLEHIVRSVVDDEDSVTVDADSHHRGGGLRLTVHVAPDDMGRVIGKRGRVAGAIRSVVRAAADKDGVSADVDFED